MEKIHMDRLNKLADFLDKLPDNRFDYRYFVGGNWRGEKDLSCGTTACAAGWACVLFPEILFLNDDGLPDLIDRKAPHASYALEVAFGLSEDEADVLFYPRVIPRSGFNHNEDDVYSLGNPGPLATAKEVAAHIRKFLAWKEKQKKK